MKKITDMLNEYHKILGDFRTAGWANDGIFLDYIIVDYGSHLLSLVNLANQRDTIEQIEDLILGTLASPWTFNDKSLPHIFPDDYGPAEQRFWNQANCEPPINLSHLLELRIGTCASYGITTAICLACTDKAEKVRLCWKPPHIWVETEGPRRLIDLSERSHGRTPPKTREGESVILK